MRYYAAAKEHASQFRTHMKSLDNPLEESGRADIIPKYSFLLLLTFEGAVKLQEWEALNNIIQVILLIF
jgi:hypothetical protein